MLIFGILNFAVKVRSSLDFMATYCSDYFGYYDDSFQERQTRSTS